MRISTINWGDDSAEKDPHLLHYFIQSPAFQRLKNKQKNIVLGRKGSGKSAVRKKLELDFMDEANTHVVNLSPKLNAIRNILNGRLWSGNFFSTYLAKTNPA